MSSGFYVIDEHAAGYPQESASPQDFHTAFARAKALAREGHRVRVLYTDDARQDEIQRLADEGIPSELVSAA